MNRRVIALFVGLAMMSLVVSGCVAAAVAGGAAAGAGGYAWSSGKLSFTTSHRIFECHDATIAALSSLGVTVTGDTTDQLAGRITGQRADGESVTIDLEPQTARITKIDIRVGFWGNEVQSKMIADAIKRNLN